MPKVKPWMEGTVVVAYRVGVRVYDLGYCTAWCGYDKPEKCPDSSLCRRYQVYRYRFNHDGTGEWRQSHANATREDALKQAAQHVAFEIPYVEKDTKTGGKLQAFIDKANEDGRI